MILKEIDDQSCKYSRIMHQPLIFVNNRPTFVEALSKWRLNASYTHRYFLIYNDWDLFNNCVCGIKFQGLYL